jgi:hypothetical protein
MLHIYITYNLFNITIFIVLTFYLLIIIIIFLVWEKLKLDKQKLMFKPDQEEEYEDSLGNVVSKRIYEDLKNNNLL